MIHRLDHELALFNTDKDFLFNSAEKLNGDFRNIAADKSFRSSVLESDTSNSTPVKSALSDSLDRCTESFCQVSS